MLSLSILRKHNCWQWRDKQCVAKLFHSENKNSSGDEIANVNFYAVRPEATRIRWNNKITPLRRSRSFKVTDFGTNRKLIYDFLLLINTNLLSCTVSEIGL